MTIDLATDTAFILLLILARVGALTMALPALGARPVPVRLRLGLALAMAVLMLPLLAPAFAPMPDAPAAALRALLVELATGLFIGLAVRLVMSALAFAGSAIAMQTGLGLAQAVDPLHGPPATMFTAFLSVLAVTLILVTDLHHPLIGAIADSYVLFKPGAMISAGDFARAALDTVAGGFSVAVRIAAPFLIFGLIFHFGIGLASRLLRRAQIFFLAVPANILIGLILLMTLLAVTMALFLQYFEAALGPFLR